MVVGGGGGGGGGVVCASVCVCVYVLVHLCVCMGQGNNYEKRRIRRESKPGKKKSPLWIRTCNLLLVGQLC